MEITQYTQEAVELLKQLISTPSISRDEQAAADIFADFIGKCGLPVQRIGNNILVQEDIDGSKPTILLNAHIDTVKPVATWSRDPFTPTIEGDRLYGLGSNDCGGGLVSLLQAFRILRTLQTLRGGTAQHPGNNGATNAGGDMNAGDATNTRGETAQHPGNNGATNDSGDMNADGVTNGSGAPRVLRGSPTECNLVFLASCEEEVSGQNGFALALPHLPKIDVAIVGEPTGLQPAIAEKGLMVIDGIARGKSGHAARDEGVNAIYEALDDLLWLRDYRFKKDSPLLGSTKMTVTVINSGTQHNVVPDECRFVIDVRTNEYYQNEYLFSFLQKHIKKCELTARSFRLGSSHIAVEHPLIQRCIQMGMTPFGSPTLSDQALMPFPSFKLGPGESSRSHSADEYICISEIEKAISTYVTLLRDIEISK